MSLKENLNKIMKKATKNFTSSLLVLALVLSASMLFACNKDGDIIVPPDTSREDAKSEFVTIVLSSINSDWETGMSNEQIALLDTCGDYVNAVYWVDFMSQVLYDSPLQTAKLQRINTMFLSDEGKALFSDAKTNSDKFLPIVNEIGLTADDVANLAYQTMYALSQSGDSVIDLCKAKLEEVKLLPQNATARDNLNDSLDYVNSLKASSTSFVQTKGEISSALIDAETGIKTISRFAFEIAMLFEGNDGGGLIAALSTGALENASVSEVAVYAESVIDSVSQMKDAFTTEELDSIETALGKLVNDADWLIRSLSDTLKGSLPFMSNLMWILKGAYLTVDIFPTLCDLIVDAGGILTTKNGAGVYANLSDLIMSLTNDQYFYADELAPNAAIIYSRMFLTALKIDYDEPDAQTLSEQIALSKQWSKDIFDSLFSSSGNNYQKNVVLFYLDLICNVRSNTEIPKVISDITVYDVMLEAFETNYYRFVGSGGKDGVTELRNAAFNFINYANITGVSSADNITKNWYDQIYNATRAKLISDVNANIASVKADLNGYIDAFFGETIIDYITLATSDLVPNTDGAGIQELVDLISKLNLAGLVHLA